MAKLGPVDATLFIHPNWCKVVLVHGWERTPLLVGFPLNGFGPSSPKASCLSCLCLGGT